MQHLPIERLAELGDVEPTRDEAEHLAQCAQCARERAAYRHLAVMAGDERTRIGPPLTEWNTLRERLSDDGLIARDAESSRWRGAALGESRRWLQGVAAVLLLASGIYGGRLSTGLSYTQALTFGENASNEEATQDFSSPAEALAVLNSAYQQYSSAATYLAANDTVSSDQAFDRFRARLAFLDQVAQSTREALAETPQDPFINQFYASTLGARDATLHRMGLVQVGNNRMGRW